MSLSSPESQPISISPPEPLSVLEKRLDLHQQFVTVKKNLIESGLLDIVMMRGDPTRGFVDSDGAEYPFPSYDSLQKTMKENQSWLSDKAEQGFTQLSIIPYLPLEEAYSGPYSFEYRIKRLIRRHKEENLIFGTREPRGDQYIALDVDTARPLHILQDILYAEQSGHLIYHPTSFDRSNHGGFTREQFIKQLATSPFSGYEVLLHQPQVYLPKQGEGETIGGRKQLENNDTSVQYLKAISDPDPNSPYRHEIGFTVETFLTDFALHLATTNHVKYDWNDQNGANLIGNYLKVSGYVPGGAWDRYDRELGVTGGDPDYGSGAWGCPPAVRVGRLKEV